MSNFGMTPFNLNNAVNQARVVLGALTGAEIPGNIANENTVLPQGFNLQNPLQNALSLAALMENNTLKLNSMQMSMFLKDTLKMPQEIKQLLVMLSQEEKPAPETMQTLVKTALKELIEQQPGRELKVPLDTLQAQLAKNTQDAGNKLIKLLQSNMTDQTQGGRQIADLMGNLSKLGEQVASSPARAVETLMLLYLPWYPLALNQKIYVEEGGGGAAEEAGAHETGLVVYLQTNTMGAFKINLRELDPLQIVLQMTHDPSAGPWLKQWESDLNDHLSQDGLPAAVWETSEATVVMNRAENTAEGETATDFAQATRQTDKKTMQIHKTGTRLSVLILMTACQIAKLIFETDEQNRPLHQA